MKKIIITLALIASNLVVAQEIASNQSKKIQLGIHYVLNNENENLISNHFTGVIGVDGRYNLLEKKHLIVQGGFTLDYLKNENDFFKKDALIWNPNVGIEYDVFKSIFRPYLNLGYAFFSNELEYLTINFDPSVAPEFTTKKVNFNGITINPGIRIHASDLIFIEASYKYFPVNSKDFEGTANVHFINFGLGVKI